MNIENLENEIWKPVPNTLDKYLISNYGRVFSKKRNKLMRIGNRSYVELCVNSNSFIIVIPTTLKELFTKEDIVYEKLNLIQDLEKEVWKSIKDYEGFYEVSNLGRIKTVERFTTHYNSTKGLRFSPEKLMELQMSNSGYYRVSLCKENKCIKVLVHRLLAQAFIPNPENKPQVNHIDGVKTNNCVENLEWCNASENALHARSLDLVTILKGEEVFSSKLKEENIIEIRTKAPKTPSERMEFVEKFNVKDRAIRDVLNKASWKHI